MDWFNFHQHSILMDILFIWVCLSVMLYLYYKNRKQVVALVQETPTAIFLVECRSGKIVDANRMAMQLLSIRRIGLRYLPPALMSPQRLLHLIAKAQTQPMQQWLVSELSKVKIHFALNRAVVDGKKVWVVHATMPPSDIALKSESVLSVQAFHALSELVFLKDAQGDLISTNKAYDRFWFQRENEGCARQDFSQLEGRNTEKRWTTTPDGKSCLLETHVTQVKAEDGKIIGSIGISHDVSDWYYMQQSCSDEVAKRQTVELDLVKSETLLQSILQASPYPIALMNQQRVHEACNQAYADSLGIAKPEDIIGHNLDELLPDNLVARFKETDLEVLQHGKTLRFLDAAKNIHGESTWYDVLKAPFKDPLTGNTGCLVIARDVTEHLAAEQKLSKAYAELERLSYFDPNLNLPNRRYFDSQLNAVWRLHLRQQSPLTVMLCNLDHLSLYKQSHGEQATEQAVRLVAEELEKITQRGADLLAINGQDEFIFLLPETQMPSCQLVVDKIHQAVAKLNLMFGEGEEQQVTISVGVASVVPQRNTEAETIVNCAMEALTLAKKQGRNQTQVAPTTQIITGSNRERSSS